MVDVVRKEDLMAQGTIRRIVVPMDFSASAAAALDCAKVFALAFHADVLILHVVEAGQVEAGSGAEDKPLRASEEPDRHEAASSRIQQDVERLRGAGVTAHQRIVEGEPLAQIVKCARSEKADLIVMGAHGREGSPRTWLGCTIERVMRRSPCPVVAVGEHHRLASGPKRKTEAGTVEDVIVEELEPRKMP